MRKLLLLLCLFLVGCVSSSLPTTSGKFERVDDSSVYRFYDPDQGVYCWIVSAEAISCLPERDK